MANVVGRIPVGADTRPLENDISAALSKNYQLKGLNDKAFTQPLGRITGSVDEFRKSLDASNARVLAFGASAGAIFAIQKGFESLVRTTINVQKNLTDINSILGLTTKNLSIFGDQLFKIAGQTGQSFETVSQAAVEFSRQGLGVEETLKRTRDALVLTRLSGLDVVSSTQALTATINSFNKVALDSTQIVNKLATVDAAFAVSSADLAEAISRVGSSADSVGVNLDQLVALVTSVQQTTARGGSVIGNSLKTIFTRLERTEVLDQLEQLGIQARNLDGSFRPAIDTLTQLAQKFDGLSDAQRANVAELVGGVFQINILKAALGDLGKQYSIYNSALNTSANATDAAIKRNEQLNQTLSSLINKTTANFTKLAADVGGITLAPAIEGLLGNINSALESFNLADAKGPGEKLAKGLLEGLGNYISGPGLALIGAVIGKLFINLAKFSGQAVGQILDINKGSQQQAEIQQRINSILAQNPNLIQGILSKQISLLEVENQILATIKAQTLAREQAATIATTLAGNLVGRGVTSTGGKISAKSRGFIPNFASPEQAEVYGAYLGGYKPGAISSMNIPGAGQVVYNTAEQVKRFPGMSQPAIMPPQSSSAGKNYAQAFQNKLGFNPYAAMGYVPNFAEYVRSSDIRAARDIFESKGPKALGALVKLNDTQYTINGREGTIINTSIVKNALSTQKAQARVLDASSIATMLVPPSGKTKSAQEKLMNFGGEDVLVKWPVKSYNPAFKDAGSILDIQKITEQAMAQATSAFIKSISPPAKLPAPGVLSNTLDTTAGSKGAITAAAGAAFEVGLRLALGVPEAAVEGINFDVIGPPNQKLAALFGYNTPLADFKINDSSVDNINSMAKKIITAAGVLPKSTFGAGGASAATKYLAKKTASRGFIPNYAPLVASMMREVSAGVAPSSVRVGQDSRLSSSENPLGLGVYNTKDEPAGLSQGIARFKDIFAARKAGAAKGFIPNYAPLNRYQRINLQNNQAGSRIPFGQGTGTLAASILLPTITGGINSALPEDSLGRSISTGIGNVGSYALTGATLAGAPGAIVGGLFGAVTSLIDIQKQIREEPYKKLEKAIQSSQEKLNSLNDSFSKFNSISEKLNQAYTGNIKLSTQELQKLQNTQVATLSSLPAETRDALLKALGEGDTLKVQRVQTEILETQQSKIKAQQAEQIAASIKLKENTPGFMDFFNAMSSETFATPSEIRKQYLKTNPSEIQKELDARKIELEQFTTQILENGQSIGEVITKLSRGGMRRAALSPEEIRTKLLGLKSQFKDATLYQEYIKDLDIQKFLDSLNKAEQTQTTIEGNAQKIKDVARGFLDTLENNITETNRIFSEGETNIANITAQIQSRRGTFLESIKDLFGEFTQLNVSKQYDEAIRNAEYQRSRLGISEKVATKLNVLGQGATTAYQEKSGQGQNIIDFIKQMEGDISQLKTKGDFEELSKQARELSRSYLDSKFIQDQELKPQVEAFANQLLELSRDTSDAANQLKALDSTTANSKRLADEEYAAREKLLRFQQAISFAGGIQTYQQNAFPGRIQEFNFARMNLGSSNLATRGRGALGILDQLKQLGIGPRDLTQTGLLDIAQTGLEADLKKYLSSIGQRMSNEQITGIASKQIQNYAKQDEALSINIPNIDTSVSDIYKQLKDQGIKVSNLEDLANIIKGNPIAPNNFSTNTGQPTNLSNGIIDASKLANMGGGSITNALYPFGVSNFETKTISKFADVPLFNNVENYQPINPGPIKTAEGLVLSLDEEKIRNDLQKQILQNAENMAQTLGDQKAAQEYLVQSSQILDEKGVSILQTVQKINDLTERQNQLTERQAKFRKDEIDHMNDLVDLANGYLTSTEYASRELERQQNLARKPGYNPLQGAAVNFVNQMSYNGTQFFQDINNSAVSVAQNIQEAFSNAFQSFASGTVTAGDAFKNFAIQILQQIQQISTQIATKLFFGALFNPLQNALGGGGGGGGGLLGGLLGGFSKGGLVKGYASGGYVNGGSGTVDDVPAMLSKGEYVLNQRAVRTLKQAYGPGFLHSLNSEGIRTMADGGGFTKNFSNQFDVIGLENTSGLNTKNMQAGLSALDAYINQLQGVNNVDPALSNYALSDSESIKNQERMQKESDFKDYVGYLLDSYNQNTATMVSAQQAYAKELDAYNRQQKQMLQSAWMTAAMAVVGGVMGGMGGGGGGLGGLFGPKPSAFAMPGGMGGTYSALGQNYGAIASQGAGQMGGLSNLFSSKNLPMLGLLGAGVIGSPFLQGMLKGNSQPNYRTTSGKTTSGLTISNRWKFADGGMAGDDIPALLMGGEFVVNKNAVKKYGTGFFEKLNNGQIKGFADGGQVGNPVLGGGAESTLNLDILTTAISELNETIKNQKDQQTNAGGDTNNITIQITMEPDGKTRENNQNNSTGGDKEDQNTNENKANKEKNMKEFTQLIKQNVLSTIIEQKRPGGLLSKTNQS